MARKDQDSVKEDRCDICGTALDDDAAVQEFPDGSVVCLCADCATSTGPEDEVEPAADLEGDDATVEWSEPHDDPTVPAPPQFEAEVFDPEEHQPQEPLPPALPVEPGTSENGASRAEAELAAWANAPSDDDAENEESALGEDYDQQKAKQAALQLVAAIAEADIAEEEQAHPHASAEATEVPVETQAESEADAEPEADADASEEDAVDMTNELLMPVTDLVALQTEMQSALTRLSSTLEHFITDMATSEEKTSAVNERVQELEDELENTRERLRAAEAAAAMAAATAGIDSELGDDPSAAGMPPTDGPVPPPLPTPGKASSKASAKTRKKKASGMVPPPLNLGAVAGAVVPPPLPGLAAGAAAMAGAAVGAAVGAATPLGGAKPKKGAAPPPLPPGGAKGPLDTSADESSEGDKPVESGKAKPADTTEPADATKAGEDLGEPVDPGPPESPSSDATAVDESALELPELPPLEQPPVPTPAHNPVAGAAAAMSKLLRGRKSHQDEPEPEPEPEPEETPGLKFTINEVQAAQRYFNESEFVQKLSEISRSIGKSQTNVSRTNPGVPEAAITVFWDIVWYQYLVDLRKDPPEDTKRVVLVQEGMDLEQLEPRFVEKNATINDDGRLDASELEVRLLSDPESLITNAEVSTPQTRLADDATEEIWDQKPAPEFRWD